MTNLIRFRSLLVAATLVAGGAACTQKSETRQEADRAAEAVKHQTEDLKDDSRDLAIHPGPDNRYDSVGDVSRDVARTTARRDDRIADDVDDIADDAKDVGKSARELADASNEFKYRKMVRI